MLEKNSLHDLRILEKYFTDLYINIHRTSGAILIKDDMLAQKIISGFVMDQIEKLKEQIEEKENNL